VQGDQKSAEDRKRIDAPVADRAQQQLPVALKVRQRHAAALVKITEPVTQIDRLAGKDARAVFEMRIEIRELCRATDAKMHDVDIRRELRPAIEIQLALIHHRP